VIRESLSAYSAEPLCDRLLLFQMLSEQAQRNGSVNSYWIQAGYPTLAVFGALGEELIQRTGTAQALRDETARAPTTLAWMWRCVMTHTLSVADGHIRSAAVYLEAEIRERVIVDELALDVLGKCSRLVDLAKRGVTRISLFASILNELGVGWQQIGEACAGSRVSNPADALLLEGRNFIRSNNGWRSPETALEKNRETV